MNYTKNQNRLKSYIKNNFLSFFKVQDVVHIATQKLKEIKQRLGESVRVYDKRFKDLLNQISSTIDQNSLVQWYVSILLQQILTPLCLYEISTCEDTLQKAQRVQLDDEGLSTSSSIKKY
jgi:hypothetical protein